MVTAPPPLPRPSSPSGVLRALTLSPPPPLPFLPFRGAGGAHVVTVNDYLAARDAEWWAMGGRARQGKTIKMSLPGPMVAPRSSLVASPFLY